jgi:iduronate 2-sulfatase
MHLKITPLLVASCALACSLTGSLAAAEKPNVLLICIDDLRPELACFGATYIHSPNIDRLAANGRSFRSHYVQAPTCGASRYTLLTGRYGGGGNGALFQRATKIKAAAEAVPASMPAWFRQHGYTTVSVGKVSHHPGGLGGRRWKDPAAVEMPNSWNRHLLPAGAWKDPQGWMHGLANGEVRSDAKVDGGGIAMDVFQSHDGPDSIYPDGPSIDEALRQLAQLTEASEKPFFLAVGILRPHLPFGAPAKYMKPYLDAELPSTPHPAKPAGKTTWHRSGEFMKYNRWNRDPNQDAEFALQVRKHYAACVSYADAQVGRVMKKLAATGAAQNTIVVLWGDHGWHLGEHAVWGKHTLFEESLRSPLIVSYPGMHAPGAATKSIVETVDLFPTLCDLSGLPIPNFVHGVSLRPLIDDPASPGHPAVSYNGRAKTIRSKTHRLILHNDGHVELYDHMSPEAETKNTAENNPALVEALSSQLKTKHR